MKKYALALSGILAFLTALGCGGSFPNDSSKAPAIGQVERVFPPGGSVGAANINETALPAAPGGPLPIVASSVSLIEGFESGLPAGWTLSGVGGTSGAVTNLAPTQGTQFAYIDNRGGTSTSAYGGTAGTTLQSSAISLSAGSVLSLKFSFMTNDGGGYSDFALIQLRNATSGAVVATLATANTTGSVSPAVPAQGGPAPAISPGVTLTPSTAYFNGLATGPIGGDNYGPGKYGGGNGGSTGWVTVNYTVPATGSYKLFFLVSDVGDTGVDSGLAVDEIGLLYDWIFTDNLGTSRVMIRKTTGDYLWELLSGGVPYQSFPGVGTITLTTTNITMRDGLRLSLMSNRTLGLTAASYTAPGVKSTLTDSYSKY